MFGWTTFGRVKFKDETYDHDICVDVEMNARPRDGKSHDITREELESLVTPETDAVVIGTGQSGCAALTPDANSLIKERQLELHIYESPKAIKEYNKICTTRKTVALIHVTC